MTHLIGGIICIALGLVGMSVWWGSFGLVMRALVPLALLVIGVLAVLSSYYRMGSSPITEEEESGED